jgi:hypothetical protein
MLHFENQTEISPKYIPFAAEPFEPLVESADSAIKHAINMEANIGLESASDEYLHAAEDLNLAAYKGCDTDPAYLVKYWAALGSVARAGDMEPYESESVEDKSGNVVLTVPKNRRKHLAVKAKRYSAEAMQELVALPDPEIETVVEAGIVAAETIESLEDGLIPRTNDLGTRPEHIIRQVSDVLFEHGNPPELRSLIITYVKHPERHRFLSQGALLSLVEGSIDPLTEAATQIEDVSNFTKAA